MARGSRARSAGHGAGEQERRPLPRGGLHGQGLGQLACECVHVCVCEPVPLHPGGTPRPTPPHPRRLSAFPSWPVGDTLVTSCGLRGRGPLCPPPLPLPPCPWLPVCV